MAKAVMRSFTVTHAFLLSFWAGKTSGFLQCRHRLVCMLPHGPNILEGASGQQQGRQRATSSKQLV